MTERVTSNVHFIADYNSYRGGLIKKMFPGSVGLVDPGDDSGMIINPNYRHYGTDADNEEFFYFVTRILSTINPTITNFKANKKIKLISEMFTIEDEAFALILVHNEVERWIDQLEEDSVTTSASSGEKDIVDSLKTNKKFCDPKSGNRDGWTKEGIELFNYLCGAVQKLRSDKETGCILEAKIRQKIVEKKKNSTVVRKPETDEQGTKRRRTTYKCDWAERQFEDFGEDAKVEKAEQMQQQGLEAQEYRKTEDENMSEKLNNSVLYAGPEEM